MHFYWKLRRKLFSHQVMKCCLFSFMYLTHNMLVFRHWNSLSLPCKTYTDGREENFRYFVSFFLRITCLIKLVDACRRRSLLLTKHKHPHGYNKFLYCLCYRPFSFYLQSRMIILNNRQNGCYMSTFSFLKITELLFVIFSSWYRLHSEHK